MRSSEKPLLADAGQDVGELDAVHGGVGGGDERMRLESLAEFLIDGLQQLVEQLVVHALDGVGELTGAVIKPVCAVGG